MNKINLRPSKIVMIDSESSNSEWDSEDEVEQILIEVALQHRMDDNIRASPGYAVAIDNIPDLYIKQDKINKSHHSYNMKHDMEYYLKSKNIKENYCTNEEFIMAMTDLGYNSQPSKTNECNINFNIIETKELRDFKKERYSK